MRSFGPYICALLIAGILAAPRCAGAHHSFSATYDETRSIGLSGPVTRVEWTNPHAYIFIDVEDSTGTTWNWALEVGNPLDLERSGWVSGTLGIGDVVEVDAIPARGDRALAYARAVRRSGTGDAVFVTAARGEADSRPAPRWPDGQVRLGPEPGEKGYWGAASVADLYEETGDPIAMSAGALLEDLSDVDRVAPLRPWSRALYQRRQRRLLIDDPHAFCVPSGGPRLFLTPHGMQLVEQREMGRIMVLQGGGNRNWKTIHIDGRPTMQPDEAVLTYLGTSTGRWDGDTLVVESVGFNERFWFSNGGLPHTEDLRLTERISRPDYDTLLYEVTIDDPSAYTRPWTARWTLEWREGEEILEFFCEENAESTFVR
jgi:hypothetical protein